MRALIHRVHKNPLVRASTIISLGWIISGALNFFSLSYLLRNISFSDFGIYVSLHAIISYLTFLQPGLLLYFVQLGSYLKNHSTSYKIHTLFWEYVKRITGSFLLVGLVFFIGKDVIVKTFGTSVFQYSWFIVSTSLIILLGSLSEGILRGLQQFKNLAMYSVVGMSMKVVLVISVILLGYSLPKILFVVLLQYCIYYALTLIPIRTLVRTKQRQSIPVQLALPPQNIMSVTAILLLLSSFVNIDILLAKRFLSAELAGIYAAQMSLVKVLLSANAMLAPIIFSLTSDLSMQGKKGRTIGLQTLAMSFALGIALVFLFKQFSTPIFLLIFKKVIHPSVNFVWIMAVSMLFFSLSYLMIHYLLSYNSRKLFIPLMFVSLVQVVILSTYHASLSQFVQSVFISYMVLFLVTSWYFIRSHPV